jgi:hypothetical protein
MALSPVSETTSPAPPERERVPTVEVRSFLMDALANGPRLGTAVRMQADSLGISERQVERARVALGVKRKKTAKGSMWFVESAPGPDADVARVPAGSRPAAIPPALSQLSRTVEALQRAGQLITIWRIVPGVPTPAYVTQVPASDFSLGWVKRALGGGRFIIDTIEVAIEGRPKEYTDPTDPNPAPVVAEPARGMDINDKLFALVLEQMKASQVRVSTDPLEMALKIVGLLRPAEPAAAGAAPMGLPGLLDLIGKVRELGIGDGAGPRETNMMDVAKEMAPTLNALAALVASRVAAGAAPHPVTSGTIGAGAPSSPAAPPTLPPMTQDGTPTPVFPATPVGAAVRELFPHLGLINAQARNPMIRPQDVAKYILDNASADLYGTIDEAVSDAQFNGGVSAPGSAVSLLAPHIPEDLVGWYASLVVAIRDDVLADRSAAAAEDGARGG